MQVIARCGVQCDDEGIGILGRRSEQAALVANAITNAGGTALPLTADVLDRAQLLAARDQIVTAWGGIDILINAAGGNIPAATVVGDRSFFDLNEDALNQVFRLNLNGSILPAQVFGEVMMQHSAGSIINGLLTLNSALPLPNWLRSVWATAMTR